MQRTGHLERVCRNQWHCIHQQSRAASSKGGISGLWTSLFGSREPEGPSAAEKAEKEVQALKEEVRVVKQHLHDGAGRLRFQQRQLAQLTNQLGYLTETTLRKLAAERFGPQSVEHKHILSIHSLAPLLLTQDALARGHEMELMGREKALAEALAVPACFTAFFAHLLRALCARACFTAFLRAFCERLKREYGRDRRLGEKISQVEHFCSEVGQHLLVRPHNARNRAVGAAVTALQQLEGAIKRVAAHMDELPRAPVVLEDPEDSSDLEPDGSNGSGSDEDTQEALPINGIGSTPALPSNGNVRAPAPNYWKIPAFKPPHDSYQPHWTHRYFSGIYKYLRAARDGRDKLHLHLLQPDSLGIALLAVASSGTLCYQFELDGQGALQVTGDSAVVTVFEFKSSLAGMAKGKQQLKARLEMLLWAITHSKAVPANMAKSLRGKGYLYFPKSSWIKAREIILEEGRTSIHIGTL